MPEYRVPKVQIVPQPDEKVSFQVDGQEKLAWNFPKSSPRPFLFPVLGPSGRPLTRMGHPAAPNHDHHRSIWIGHRSIGDLNFWEERGGAQQIRQEQWIHYQDGEDEAGMAIRLGWFDGHNAKVLGQDLTLVYRPLPENEGWFEIQSTFTTSLPRLAIGQTNFGFFGLRVAASLSAHFGNGRLTDDQHRTGERAIFSQQARWMDYSGPIVGTREEGITWFDHPENPNYPSSWHVRDDGWMSAASNFRAGSILRRGQTLRLRYGFYVHTGVANHNTNETKRRMFEQAGAWELARAERPWRYHLRRRTTKRN
ncbi:MAG: PmoA family protein [Gemmataceae bacterium]